MQRIPVNRSKEWLFRSIMICAALFYLFFILRTQFSIGGTKYFTLVDDAMISMRYARNLASGQGLVWNIGQPPVEGFTNLGWVLVMAIVHLFGLPQNLTSLPIMFFGIAILVANLFVIRTICLIVFPKYPVIMILSVFLVAFYFPLVYWTLRGMEVGAQVLLLDLAILIILSTNKSFTRRKNVFLGIIYFLLILLRIDSIVFIGVLLIYQFLKSTKKTDIIIPATISCLTILLIIIFQIKYYGYPLSNTYYLKMDGVPLIDRVRLGLHVLFTISLGDFVFPLLILIGLFIISPKSFSNPIILFITFFLSCIFYSIYIGGDFAEFNVGGANRFILLGMPALFICFSFAIETIINRFHLTFSINIVAGLIGILAILLSSGNEWISWLANNAPLLESDIQSTKIGILISENTSKNIVIASHTAGQIPYYSQRTTIDLLGKNDTVIAHGIPAGPFRPGHNKWNYTYSILELKPDLIADEWGNFVEFMRNHPNNYVRLKNGIWINKQLIFSANLTMIIR